MTKKEKQRVQYRSWKKSYYHLSTDGWKDGHLFHTPSQYAYGMTLIGLLTLRFDIRVYAFSLMRNHLHMLVSGTGSACVEAFDYLKRKINARLVKDGFPLLPDDYWFKLVPIDSQEQMKNDMIYIDRNAYEIQSCVPSGYIWSSSYLHFSQVGKMLFSREAGTISKREMERLTGSRTPIPPHWQFHPEYGLLPSSFIDNSLFLRLFPNPKDYETSLVKDYESFVRVAASLGETVSFSQNEVKDIVRQILNAQFSGRPINRLSHDEKAKIVLILNSQYKMPAEQIGETLSLPEFLVRQFIRAKDYGNER